MSIQEWIEALTAKGIHSVLAQFADIHGVAKGKLVPLKYLHDLGNGPGAIWQAQRILWPSSD
jgi:glutamine synthetase